MASGSVKFRGRLVMFSPSERRLLPRLSRFCPLRQSGPADSIAISIQIGRQYGFWMLIMRVVLA